MSFFSSRKLKEFWGFMAASFVCYLLSTLFEKQDLKSILLVTSAILFVVALFKLKGHFRG